MKNFKLLLISALILSSSAFAKDMRIQNEDVKPLAAIKASAQTTTGTLTSGSPCIASPGTLLKITVGLYVYDTTTPGNLPSGVKVAALPGACPAGQIRLTANATGSGVANTLTFGGQPSQLPNDDKIWIKANGINKTLNQAILDGNIGGTSATIVGMKAYVSTTTGVITGQQNIVFDGVSYDVGSHYDNTTGFYTISKTGYWMITTSVRILNQAAVGNFFFYPGIRMSTGSPLVGKFPGVGTGAVLNSDVEVGTGGAIVSYFTLGDVIVIYGNSNSTYKIIGAGDFDDSHMEITFLGI